MALPRATFLAVVATAAGALLPAAAPAAGPTARAAAVCRGADVTPTAANLGTVRRATLCLLNRERRSAGLGSLREHISLRVAARRYATQMVRQQFFAHDAPDGSSFIDRLKRTTYLRTARRWSVGENLAWGSGEYATPRRTVRNWMESPGHRANILTPGFRHIGIGITLGAPAAVDGGLPAATYVTEFGRRS
ncbi:MAG TPA: CAP domain-containing protein [Baekduia sp.]|nr:CAP domain-containing protein [Baekduia sp.]